MDGSNHIDMALRSYVDRIVHLHEDRDNINGDIREVYGELKDAGFNVTIVRGMVKEQRMDADARNSLYQLQEEYRIKLGLLAGTPLGEAAVQREAAYEAANRAHPLPVSEMPRPFSEQPVHAPKRRGRPRKTQAERTEEHLANARVHLNFDDEPRGNA